MFFTSELSVLGKASPNRKLFRLAASILLQCRPAQPWKGWCIEPKPQSLKPCYENCRYRLGKQMDPTSTPSAEVAASVNLASFSKVLMQC